MFRTNFDSKYLQKYKRAIIEFEALTGSDRFYIKDDAFDFNGRLMGDSHALHDKEKDETSLFWKIFDNLNIITKSEMFQNMQYYMEYCQENDYVTPQKCIEKYKHF